MSLDPATLERCFADFLALPERERPKALRELAAEAPALADRVAALLEAHATATLELDAWSKRTFASSGLIAEGDLIGRTIGGWKLERELGRGGMGVVYAGVRQREGVAERAAIKMLSVAAFDASAAQRFVREAAVLARLDHPGICRLRDWGRSDEGWPYLVLDLVDGQSITRHAGALSVARRIELIAEVADAVGAAHRRLVVHLDLKPDNVLVGADGRVVLLDFGISRVLSESNDQNVLTQTRWLTPDYASPEQLQREPTSVAADIYSLGAIAYEVMAGRRPFALSGVPVAEALRRIEVGPEPLSGSQRSLPSDLAAVISKAMHVDPARRYLTVHAFAEDLRAVLNQKPVAARPDSIGYRLRKLVYRNPIAVPLAGLAIVAILLLAVLLSLQAVDLRAQRDRAEQEAEHARLATNFLLDSIKAADPTGEAGPGTTVEDLLKVTERRVDDDLADRPHSRSLALLQIASVRRSVGDDAAAEQVYRRALELLDTLGGDQPARTAAVAGLADSLRRLERSADARALLEAELSSFKPDGHWQLWAALGKLRLHEGEVDEARSDLVRALAQAPEHDASARAAILSDLGYGMAQVGNYAESLAWYQQAVETAQGSSTSRGMLSIALANLSDSLSKLGRLDEALDAIERSLALRVEMFGEHHVETIPMHINRAFVLIEAGRWDEALATARHAGDLERELSGGDTRRMIHIWNAIGLAGERKGDTATARQGFSSALEIAAALLPSEHPAIANINNNLASVMMEDGDYETSLTPLQQAWEIYRASAAGQASRGQAIAAANIAYSLLQLDRAGEALAWSADALHDASQVMAPDQWILAHIRNIHADALVATGAVDEGEREAREVDRVYAESPVPVREKSIRENLQLLARICRLNGDQACLTQFEQRLSALPEP